MHGDQDTLGMFLGKCFCSLVVCMNAHEYDDEILITQAALHHFAVGFSSLCRHKHTLTAQHTCYASVMLSITSNTNLFSFSKYLVSDQEYL